MIYTQLSPEDLELLEKEMKTTNNKKWYFRLRAIQLSSYKYKVPEIAIILDLCQATIRAYIKHYNKGGLKELKPNYGIGCPPKIKLSKAEWQDLLARSPSQFEKLATGDRNWTQPMLVKYFALYQNIETAVTTISDLLKRLGFHWGRGKLKVTSPDPEYIVKRKRIEKFKKKPI